MSKVRQRRTAILAVITSLFLATAAQAQMPTSPWKKAAPFPEPDEELYGVAVNGKLYVIGGWGEGKARGANYEYGPATDKWTKKTSMPRPAHHAALAAYNGKIYVCGGFVPPENTQIPTGYVAGGRGDDQRARRRVSRHRGVRAGDQFVDHAALHADERVGFMTQSFSLYGELTVRQNGYAA